MHAALRSKSNEWLAQNQDNVSEWSVMSIIRLLFQHYMYNNLTELVGVVQRGHHHHLIVM
jgi:hypothetical protein